MHLKICNTERSRIKWKKSKRVKKRDKKTLSPLIQLYYQNLPWNTENSHHTGRNRDITA